MATPFTRRIFFPSSRPRTSEVSAIDIETNEYEIAADELRACDKLRKRIPDAQIWMVRVGYRSVHSFGGRIERQERPCGWHRMLSKHLKRAWTILKMLAEREQRPGATG